MSARPESPVLVGRDAELAALRAVLADVRAGGPGTALVGGEAGIGKSRLVRELARAAAADAPVRVLTAGCVELGAGGLPFAPFVTVLRDLVRDLGADRVRALLPHGGPGELGRLLPALGAAGGRDGMGLARAGLFEEYLSLLTGLAGRETVLLVVEDLHWADRSSRDLLRFLVGNQHAAPGLMLVATYRDDRTDPGGRLRAMLAELDRSAWVRRIELGRLDRAGVAAQLRGLTGREPDPVPAERVFRRSGGNPLLVEALADRDGVAVPESVRDLLTAGLERLPERTRRAVRAAAVGGVRVGHPLLAAVAGLGDAGLTAALRPAVEANILAGHDDGYAFRHPLAREALYAGMLPGERAPLHARYAEALEADPALATGSAAAEAAHHWHATGRHPARALAAALRAAAQARATLAHAERLSLLLTVLDLWDRVPDAAGAAGMSRDGVVDEAVLAAVAAGETDRAMDLIDAALSAGDGAVGIAAGGEAGTRGRTPISGPAPRGGAERRGSHAAGPERPQGWAGTDPARAGRLLAHRGELRDGLGLPGDLADLREAARLVPPGHPDRAPVLNALARRLLTVPRETEGRAYAREAVTAARDAGDDRSEMMAEITLGYAEARAGDLAGALPRLVAARERAGRTGDHDALMYAYRCEADALQGAGRYDEAARAARDGLAAATAAGLARTCGPTHAGNLAEALAALGRWDEAVDTVGYGLDLVPPPAVHAYLLVVRAEIALARGDLAAAGADTDYARDVFTRATVHAQDHLMLVRLEADLLLARGRRDDAARVVRDALRADADPSPRYLWPVLEAGARAGSTGLSRPAATLPVIGPVQQAHRLAYAAESARSVPWERVAAAWEELRQPYPRARALVRAAEEAAGRGDRGAAGGHLREAARIADELSAGPLRAEVDRLARSARLAPPGAAAGTAATGAPAARYGLTAREREVLRLVADGRTNREIAGELFISVKTAGTHVSNILAKLGVTGRVHAATAAHRDGLLTD